MVELLSLITPFQACKQLPSTLQNGWDTLVLETLRASLESHTLNTLTPFHPVSDQKVQCRLGPQQLRPFLS